MFSIPIVTQKTKCFYNIFVILLKFNKKTGVCLFFYNVFSLSMFARSSSEIIGLVKVTASINVNL